MSSITRMPCHLLALPDELLVCIFTFCGHRDVLRCSETSKILNDLIKTSVALQYRIELSRRGMQDGDAAVPPITVDERLRMLRELSDRRRRFEPILLHEVSYMNSYVSDNAEGIYAALQRSDVTDRDGRYSGALFCLYDITRPTSAPIKQTTLDIDTRDLTIVPSRDLVIFVDKPSHDLPGPTITLRIYPRTLSSGGTMPHPDAQLPVIEVFDVPEGTFDSYWTLKVEGDVFAIYMEHEILRIVRWTTGHLLASWSFKQVFTRLDDGRYYNTCFSLVSSTCFIVGLVQRHKPATIAVLSIPNHDSQTPSHGLNDHSRVMLEMFHPAEPGVWIVELRDMFTNISPSTSGAAFVHASRIATATMTAWRDDQPGSVDGRSLAFRTEVFEETLECALKGAPNEDTRITRTLSWETWGPQNVRMFEGTLNEILNSSGIRDDSYGSRATFTSWGSEVHRIFDFAETRDAGFLHAVESGEAGMGPLVERVWVSDAGMHTEGIWRGIQTKLPYFVIETRFRGLDSQLYQDLMLDGQYMIWLNYMQLSTRRTNQPGSCIVRVYKL